LPVRAGAIDTDGDGLFDSIENGSQCLDVNDADTDDDGILDGIEDKNHNGAVDAGETNPCDNDSDDDGILDGSEDKDHDGLLDAGETDPSNSDTDGDGIQDGTESGLTLDKIGPDTDTAKFIPDADPLTKTNPLDNDTDNDGIKDGKEDKNFNGRVDNGETDPNVFNRRLLPFLQLLIED
jgi:large repetitive protein